MGQCQSSDNNSLSGRTSLPPTLSRPYAYESRSEAEDIYLPKSKQSCSLTLSPPQSPAMTVTRSKGKIKEAEVEQTQTHSIGMAIESEKIKEAEHVTTKSGNVVKVSSNIEIVDIKPKMTAPLRATKSSPPIPFHRQQATPRLNIGTDKTEAAVVAVKKEDFNGSDTKKARYEGIFRILFISYIAAIAFFFIMCRGLFAGVAPDVPVMGGTQVTTITPHTNTSPQLGFLQAIGHFNLQEDLMPLLPLNAVKEMLSDNKDILDMIEQELRVIHDAVLI